MLLWSTQWKVVNEMAASFTYLKKLNIKVSKSFANDKVFLNPHKYETTGSTDFKFYCMWIAFENNATRVDLLLKLKEANQSDLKRINYIKGKIVNYYTTLEKDIQVMNAYTMSYDVAVLLYNQEEISVLGLWWALRKLDCNTRLQKKYKKRVEFFMSYFETIKENLIQRQGQI